MWFLIVFLALMARGSACPDLCQCHPEPPAQMTCFGRTPPVSQLPSRIQKLEINNVEESEVRSFLDELENSTSLLYLETLVLRNNSLGAVNITWSGLESVRVLNLSENVLEQVKDVRKSDAECPWNVTVLELSNNRIGDIEADVFRTFPGLTWLRLSHNSIGNVSENAFRGLGALEILELGNNKLTLLPDNALMPLEALQKLDLSGNQLQSLGAKWFESLDRLRELDVSRNGLSRAAPGVLQPLPGLSVLRLAENPLKERDVSLLLGTGKRLETVDASHTGLIRVPVTLTRSVRTLRLAGNKLTSIRGGDLDSYPLLRLLDLSDNQLSEIEEDALGRLEVLEDLNLRLNLLIMIPRSLPGSLISLDLERNAIKQLRVDDLQGLSSLRTLKLNDNEIESVEDGSFSQLSALEELNVSNNPIKVLPANTFSGLANLVRLGLSGLGSLSNEEQKQRDMAFPVPSPERLTTLDISHSPVLAVQLLNDDATLSACKSLLELNLANVNITDIRSDLIYILPQLRKLGLSGNIWNCSQELYWLGEWIRQHGELDELARCSQPPELAGYYLSQMPRPPNLLTTQAPKMYNITSTATNTANEVETNSGSTITGKRVTTTSGPTIIIDKIQVPSGPTIDKELRNDKNRTENLVINYPAKELILAKQKSELGLMREDIRTGDKVVAKLEKTKVESHTREGDNQRRKVRVEKEKGDVSSTNDVSNTVAQELSGQVNDSDSRVSETAGAHPGMLVLAGAALGAVVALSVVLSRRATVLQRDRRYQRQENIEVHSLTSTIDRW